MDDAKLEKQVQKKEIDQNLEKPTSKNSGIKYILNISFVLIATGLSIFFALKDDAPEIARYLVGANVWSLLVVVLIMVACALLRSFILYCFAHLFTRKYRFHQALAVDQIGV
ncbi:MAG: hypothetical protein GX813_03395, partial [Erysipelotrichia bacterium]|nr:hypothetical protein [Erysipelotrichia bacterium]